MIVSAEMEPNVKEVVIIIESPGPKDVLENRTEGRTLFESLKLAGIPCHYYQAINLETFRQCFDLSVPHQMTRITQTRDGKQQTTMFMPHFHISAHGNKNGISLSSGEFIGWSDMRRILLDYATKTGRVDKDNNVCLFTLALSTCEGGYAEKMFADPGPKPCFALVGPTDTVFWEDALVAYTTFYHLIISKKQKPIEAIGIVNKAAGLEGTFKVHHHSGRSK